MCFRCTFTMYDIGTSVKPPHERLKTFLTILESFFLLLLFHSIIFISLLCFLCVSEANGNPAGVSVRSERTTAKTPILFPPVMLQSWALSGQPKPPPLLFVSYLNAWRMWHLPRAERIERLHLEAKNIRMRHKYSRPIRKRRRSGIPSGGRRRRSRARFPTSDSAGLKVVGQENREETRRRPGEVCRIIYSCPRRTTDHFHSAVKRS